MAEAQTRLPFNAFTKGPLRVSFNLPERSRHSENPRAVSETLDLDEMISAVGYELPQDDLETTLAELAGFQSPSSWLRQSTRSNARQSRNGTRRSI